MPPLSHSPPQTTRDAELLVRRKTDICPFPEHPRSPYTGLRAVPLLTEGLAVVEGLGVVSQGGPAADGAGLVLRSKWDQMRPFSMREPPRTRRPGNVTSEMDEASSDKTSPCGRAMRRTRARFRPHRAPPPTAPTLSFRIMRRRQKGKRGEGLRGQLIEQLAARGYEFNIYNVPNMKAFLETVLLLPRSITVDSTSPQWNYFGRGSGQDGQYHEYLVKEPVENRLLGSTLLGEAELTPLPARLAASLRATQASCRRHPGSARSISSSGECSPASAEWSWSPKAQGGSQRTPAPQPHARRWRTLSR